VFGRLESTHFYERHVLGATYRRIWQQLQMVFSHLPSGTMELTSGSNQRYKRGQKSPLDPIALAGLLQSGYSLVHGRLKMSKMAKFVISPPSPLLATRVKTNICGNQPLGAVWGIPLNIFTSQNSDKQTFFFLVCCCCCLVLLFVNFEYSGSRSHCCTNASFSS